MKPAWTTTLFLRINAYVGTYPWMDRVMIFCAHYLVWLLSAILVIVWGRDGQLIAHLSIYGYAFCVSIICSYLIAFLWRQPRPVRRLPEIKTLISTLGTWKTFPSDHAIAATMLAYAGYKTFSSPFEILFVCLCMSIAFARVWVGVHYPRDILGGVTLASLVLSIVQFITG